MGRNSVGHRAVWAAVVIVVLGGLFAMVVDVAEAGMTAGEVVRLGFNAVLFMAFVVCGGTLIANRPDHAVSWLLPLPVVYLVLDASLDLVERVVPAAVDWYAWLASVSFVPTFLALVVFLPQVFPDGRPVSSRWRWLLWTSGIAVVLMSLGNAIDPALLDTRNNPVPFESDGVSGAVMAVGGGLFVLSMLGAIASAVARFRRATGVERLQLRWFTWAALVAVLGWIASVALDPDGSRGFGGHLFATGLLAMPLAVTVAVLRYRLYDIDRIVSRTVSYSLVTAILVGVYMVVALAPVAVLPGDSTAPDIMVALGTLAVAAFFRPVRSKVQERVNRRFDRARYDAAAVVEGFGARLRDEIDLDLLTEDLLTAAVRALTPAHASVWLHGPRPGSTTSPSTRHATRA